MVRVYLTCPESAVERSVRWRAGSAVVVSDPGASMTAEVTIRAPAFRHWDEAAGGWAQEPGEFTVVDARNADAGGLTVPVVRG